MLFTYSRHQTNNYYFRIELADSAVRYFWKSCGVAIHFVGLCALAENVASFVSIPSAVSLIRLALAHCFLLENSGILHSLIFGNFERQRMGW